MFITATKSNIKTIRPGDPDWIIVDGLTVSHRAGFEICGSMPYEYKLIVTECMNKGWLQPIAHQPVHEHFMEELTK
jgi:hypothetical protein